MSKMKTLEVLQQYLLHSGQSEELKEVSAKQIDAMIKKVKKHVTENYVNSLFTIKEIIPAFDFVPKEKKVVTRNRKGLIVPYHGAFYEELIQKYLNVFNVKMLSTDEDLNGTTYNVIVLVNDYQIISLRQNGKIQNIK